MQKIIDKIKKYTYKDLCKIFLRKILFTSIYKYHYLRLNTDIDKINNSCQNQDFDVKELCFADFLRGDPVVFNEKKLSLINKRFKDPTYMAYGIIENEQLVYSTWFSTRKLGLPIAQKKTAELLPDEGLLEDSYCHPVARGRGYHGKMNVFRIKKLYELGKTRVLALVLDGNSPAMKVQKKCGFEELGYFYCGYIFGIKFNTLKKYKFDNL